MKAFLALALVVSTSAFAGIDFSNVECYSDMSDGECKVTETDSSFKGHCTIDVTLTLDNGEKVPAVLEGHSNVKKNSYALMMNDVVKDRALSDAGRDLGKKLFPFYDMKSCQ